MPAFHRVLAGVRERLYSYDAIRALKDRVRPLKHFLFGRDDIYLVVERLNQARGARRPVRVVFDVGAAWGDKTVTFLGSFP